MSPFQAVLLLSLVGLLEFVARQEAKDRSRSRSVKYLSTPHICLALSRKERKSDK